MKKIILVFSILVTFLFSFSNKSLGEEYNKEIELLSLNSSDCSQEDSIVNITTVNNLINASGFIVYKDDYFVYIVTSYVNYNEGYNYEVVFNDYVRASAKVIGVAKEDEILLLKASITDTASYCPVKFSKSEYIDIYEKVNIVGKYQYKTAFATGFINSIGICKNLEEETYKKYYYSLITVDIDDYLIGAGAFDEKGQLLGIITNRVENFKLGISMLDVNKLYSICYNLITTGKYNKNYIKYNLLNVNSLTKHEKYLYSLDEGLTNGVLVSSIHYLNYITGGLNQGMIILSVNDVNVSNCYELDNELSKYKKGAVVYAKALTITKKYKTFQIRL